METACEVINDGFPLSSLVGKQQLPLAGRLAGSQSALLGEGRDLQLAGARRPLQRGRARWPL